MTNISGLASGSTVTAALSAVQQSTGSNRGATSPKGAAPDGSSTDTKTSAAKHTDLNVHTDSAGAVQAQINQDQIQLNDWVTCVSASTPKGKEEIQSISTQISAAESRLHTIEASQAAVKAAQGPAGVTATATGTSRVDAWA